MPFRRRLRGEANPTENPPMITERTTIAMMLKYDVDIDVRADACPPPPPARADGHPLPC